MTNNNEVTNNQPASYIVHATPEQMAQIRYTVNVHLTHELQESHAALCKTAPLDLDALRLVLDAANCHRETMDERANDPSTLDDQETRKECDAIGDSIAKLESLTK